MRFNSLQKFYLNFKQPLRNSIHRKNNQSHKIHSTSSTKRNIINNVNQSRLKQFQNLNKNKKQILLTSSSSNEPYQKINSQRVYQSEDKNSKSNYHLFSNNSFKNTQRKRHKKHFFTLFNNNKDKKEKMGNKSFSQKSQKDMQKLQKAREIHQTTFQNSIQNTDSEQMLSKLFQTADMHGNVLNFRESIKNSQQQNIDFVSLIKNHSEKCTQVNKNQNKQCQQRGSIKLYKKNYFELECYSTSARKLFKLRQKKENFMFNQQDNMFKRIKLLKNLKDISMSGNKIAKNKSKVTEQEWEYFQSLSKQTQNVFGKVKEKQGEEKVGKLNHEMKILQKQRKSIRLSESHELAQMSKIKFQEPKNQLLKSKQFRKSNFEKTNETFIQKIKSPIVQKKQIGLASIKKIDEIKKQLQIVNKIQLEQNEKNQIDEKLKQNKKIKDQKQDEEQNSLLMLKKMVEQIIDPMLNLPNILLSRCKKYQIKSGIAIYFLFRQFLYLRKYIEKFLNLKYKNKGQKVFLNLNNKDLIKWINNYQKQNQQIEESLDKMSKTISYKKQVSFDKKYLKKIKKTIQINQYELQNSLKEERQIFMIKNIKIFKKILSQFKKSIQLQPLLYQLIVIYGSCMINIHKLASSLSSIINLTKQYQLTQENLTSFKLISVKYLQLNQKQFQKLMKKGSNKFENDLMKLLTTLDEIQNS